MNPLIYIFFGKAGAGKTYVGKLCAAKFDFVFFEGDLVIPSKMLSSILKKELISNEMLNEFLLDSLKQKIENLVTNLKDGQSLIVSQAFYRIYHRDYYRRIFKDQIQFVLIDSDDDTCYKRLNQRNDWVDIDYAKKLLPYFQQPKADEKCAILSNMIGNNDINIIQQFSMINCAFDTR